MYRVDVLLCEGWSSATSTLCTNNGGCFLGIAFRDSGTKPRGPFVSSIISVGVAKNALEEMSSLHSTWLATRPLNLALTYVVIRDVMVFTTSENNNQL